MKEKDTNVKMARCQSQLRRGEKKNLGELADLVMLTKITNVGKTLVVVWGMMA